jgi:membrane associated rhomboid family serine protease
MIPIRDVVPSRTKPVVTFSLIIANALAFLYQSSMDPAAADRFVYAFGLVPASLTASHAFGLATAMFLHADWVHLTGNLLFLWIFGENVEDLFGHRRFLAFYLIAGLAANVAQVAAAPLSVTPIIGASGAVAAVMGAYFVLFPRSRVVMLIWLLFYVDFVEIPAVLFLGFWLVFQFIGGLGQAASGGGVAFFAHIGGFAAGAATGRWLARSERMTVEWWDRPTAP